MNLQPVANAAIPVLIGCCQCHGTHFVGKGGDKMFADIDGDPWKVYYCSDCLPPLIHPIGASHYEIHSS